MVRIKVDEDLPGEIAVMLRAAGHDAKSVVEQRLAGSADGELWQIVQAESRILLTADKGFGDIRVHPPGTHAGVVLMRLPRESRAAYLRLAEAFLKRFPLKSAVGDHRRCIARIDSRA